MAQSPALSYPHAPVPDDRKIFRTISPRAGYGADVIRVHVEDGRVVKVEGDQEDRISQGALTVFAKRYLERLNSKDRLLQPMSRVGDPGSDKFEPISWDAAIDRIGEALERVGREQDPRALLYYAGHGHDGVMTQFGTLFLSYFGGHSSVYGDLCSAAGMEATRLTFGALHHHRPEDYRNSKMVVIWGKNPAITNPHQMRFLAAARKQGTKLDDGDVGAGNPHNKYDMFPTTQSPGTSMYHCLVHSHLARGCAHFSRKRQPKTTLRARSNTIGLQPHLPPFEAISGQKQP